jgi:coatomer subunit beta'
MQLVIQHLIFKTLLPCACYLPICVQPLRLEIKKMMTSRSDRVKSVDLYPTEPWVLVALYNGTVFIWDYEQARSVKNFEVCSLPVRCAKFIVRKQWFVTASDDMHMRVYNYNTMEKVRFIENEHMFEHRCVQA